jgi:hypothetical protein
LFVYRRADAAGDETSYSNYRVSASDSVISVRPSGELTWGSVTPRCRVLELRNVGDRGGGRHEQWDQTVKTAK